MPKKWIRVLQAMQKVKSGTSWTVGQFYRELAKLGGFLSSQTRRRTGLDYAVARFQKLTLMVLRAEALRRKCG